MHAVGFVISLPIHAALIVMVVSTIEAILRHRRERSLTSEIRVISGLLFCCILLIALQLIDIVFFG